MRKAIFTAGAAIFSAFILQTSAFADVIDISGAPGEAVNQNIVDIVDNKPAKIVQNDDAVITKSNIIEISSDIFSGGTISSAPSDSMGTGPFSNITETDPSATGPSATGPSVTGPSAGPAAGPSAFGPSAAGVVPGSAHINDQGVEVQLPFKLAVPNISNGKHRVAEGSVQLSDGSWDMIGHNKILRGPYYRVLKEVTDYSGVDWYVCDVSASSIGAYKTSDGSRAEELWLKKSDCVEKSSIYLNTTNQTRINIVVEALACLGKGYSSGGSGEDSFDCSGLVNYVYKKAGVKIPRQSSAICAMSGQIGIEELRPGDILGRPGHVGVYIADGIFIHASERSTGVVAELLNNYNNAIGFSNYINALGD